MGLLKFYNAVDLLALMKAERGWLASDPTTKPGAVLIAGDVETVEYVMLTRNPDGGTSAPWSRVPVAQYTLQMGLFLNSDRSQLSYNNAFTPDGVNNKYSGSFSLNTSAIQTLFNSTSADQLCTLELQSTDLSGYTKRVYRNTSVILQKGLITPGALVNPAGEVAATQSWARQTFMPRNWPIGMHFIGRDANGNAYDCYLDVDGYHADPLSNPPPGPDPNI